MTDLDDHTGPPGDADDEEGDRRIRGDQSDGDGDLEPADAFATLGHPLRVDIVATLHEHARDAPLSFSTLYEAVDADGTGQFNYHLGELVPHFVARTDDGYELAAAGERLARAVTSGTFTATPELEPFEVDGRCYDCGSAPLRGAYADERFRVECEDCDQIVLDVDVPPSLVRDRDPPAFVDAFDEWSTAQVDQAHRGLCPDCGGAVVPDIVSNTHETLSFDRLARFDCRVCGRSVVTSFGAVAARHPAVESFLEARDVDLDDRYYWKIPQYMTDEQVEVLADDPTRVRVTFHADGEACRVVLDGDLEVVETRVDGGSG